MEGLIIVTINKYYLRLYCTYIVAIDVKSNISRIPISTGYIYCLYTNLQGPMYNIHYFDARLFRWEKKRSHETIKAWKNSRLRYFKRKVSAAQDYFITGPFQCHNVTRHFRREEISARDTFAPRFFLIG